MPATDKTGGGRRRETESGCRIKKTDDGRGRPASADEPVPKPLVERLLGAEKRSASGRQPAIERERSHDQSERNRSIGLSARDERPRWAAVLRIFNLAIRRSDRFLATSPMIMTSPISGKDVVLDRTMTGGKKSRRATLRANKEKPRSEKLRRGC